MKTLAFGMAALVLVGCSSEERTRRDSRPETRKDSTPPAHADGPSTVKKNLENFDDLDFNVFSKQQWDRLSKSHSKDIVVHWPDGRKTRGLDPHTDDLKGMFLYAPNTRITAHPISFGSGEYTCVTGVMEGTFSAPMKVEGRTVQPTGKSFRLDMCTVGRWKDGVMVEEWLFWDNHAFMKQIGLLDAPKEQERP